VFLADNSCLCLKVALKILPENSSEDKERLRVLNGNITAVNMLSPLTGSFSCQLDDCSGRRIFD
jgi:hypothetical protein